MSHHDAHLPSREELAAMIQRPVAPRLKQAALAHGMVTLKQEGAERVIQGHTTLEEVMRITQQEIDVE